VEQSEKRLEHLCEIVDMSIKLGHLCAAQRPRFEFAIPKPNATFDPDSMEIVPNLDVTDASSKPIWVGAFPCLLKYEEHGGQDVSDH
jgi:hypothetical protein